MFDEQKEIGEGFLGLKRQLKKIILEGYKVTVSDTDILKHYFQSQANLDHKICDVMGWKWQEPKESTKVKD